jgi:hypothetical protein
MAPILRVALPFVLALLLLSPFTAAADPLDPKAVPDPLKPWTPWVLEGAESELCPVFYGKADVSRCAWPSRLELTLDEHGGHFTQHWHVDAKGWLPLPGDDKRWPMGVQIDGARAIVAVQSDGPNVSVARGDHTITGSFAWDSLPESIHVPPETGILSLALRGLAVASPNCDAQGTVWLQKAAANEEGDSLELIVQRKVTDDIPLELDTHIELHVAGKNREELLGKALPQGFTPMSLDAPLPARLEPDGRLRVQLRPGVFSIELVARSDGPVSALSRPAPDGPWREGEEVWVFEAKNDYRIVTVEGVPSIDPQQTTLRDAWKRLPAYPMNLGATLRLVEKRRGDADPPPDQLTLSRTLWLDFAGTGYAVSDTITGAMNRDARLTMAPPTVLGRASIGGTDQFITRLDVRAHAGIEVRQGQLAVKADSRVPGDPSDIPAVGWDHDFHQVAGALHLPPGWRLLHASGVDEVPATWVRQWSLLQLFLALVIALGVARLYGVRWGVLALVMLVLTLPEDGAPRWLWLLVLGTEALHRVLPAGKIKRLFAGARLGAVVVVALTALPFLVDHLRQAMYPALADESAIVGSNTESPSLYEQDTATRAKGDVGAKDIPAPAEATLQPAAPPIADGEVAGKPGGGGAGRFGIAAASPSASAWSGAYRPSNPEVYDPTAIVQTGPGLPRWRWTTLDLRWSGPVAATQRLHFYLLSPNVNLLLAFARAALLIALVLRVLPWAARFFPRGWAPAAAAALLLLLPRAAHADIPTKEMLQELHDRLLRKADCTPTCASSGRMAIEARGAVLRIRVEVDASAPTAVPLPGKGAQWTPKEVLLDGQPAKGLVRLDDVVWIELAPGNHQIALEGPMPDRESVQLALNLKPHHVEATTAGWTLDGLHEDGIADEDLQFTRVRTVGGAGASLQPGALPPFVRVERTLSVGLNWQVDTRVVRVTPKGSAVVLEVPLLTGESVTTADVRVVSGKALVNLGPQALEATWHGTLEQKSPLKLVAPRSVSWVEVWRIDVAPIWHATYAGIPFVHTGTEGGPRLPEWRPWPGDEATATLVRPAGVPGQTLTIDESTTELAPGIRATDVTLRLSLRSSRGGEHTLTLPPDAQLEAISINGATQPIRQEGRKVTVPLVPGPQSLVLSWRETPGIGLLFGAPAIDLGAPSVNATTALTVPGGRWLLLAGGPRVGPAVLFWSLLAMLLVVSLALGKNRWTPLRWWHWLLLGVGLSQVSVVAGAIFVGWLLAVGWRDKERGEGLGRRAFNWRQSGLVLWTAVALGILAVSLYQGLLGAPEMQVRGNGSSADLLRWFVDRSEGALPGAWMVSIPILVYRGVMLAWALWIALALLGWLRWGWAAFTSGGGWRKPSPPQPLAPLAPLTGAAPPPPPAEPPQAPA